MQSPFWFVFLSSVATNVRFSQRIPVHYTECSECSTVQSAARRQQHYHGPVRSKTTHSNNKVVTEHWQIHMKRLTSLLHGLLSGCGRGAVWKGSLCLSLEASLLSLSLWRDSVTSRAVFRSWVTATGLALKAERSGNAAVACELASLDPSPCGGE